MSTSLAPLGTRFPAAHVSFQHRSGIRDDGQGDAAPHRDLQVARLRGYGWMIHHDSPRFSRLIGEPSRLGRFNPLKNHYSYGLQTSMDKKVTID